MKKLTNALALVLLALGVAACSTTERTQTRVVTEGAGAGTTWTPNPVAPDGVTTEVKVGDEQKKTTVTP